MDEQNDRHLVELKDACDSLSFLLQINSTSSFKISTDNASGVSLIVDLEENNFSFYFLVRTFDGLYQGDRSDAHVILALMFACFIRMFGDGISCSMFDIAHPVVEDEVWGRYIMPVQMPNFLGTISKKDQFDKIATLMYFMAAWREWFWAALGCPCNECQKKAKLNSNRKYDTPYEIKNTIEQIFKFPERYNYGNRSIPNWYFFYDIDHEVTIVKSKEVSTFLKRVISVSNRSPQKIKALSGTLIIDGELNNYLSDKAKSTFSKVIKSLLKKTEKIYYDIIPMENMLVAVADQYIVALGKLAGIHEFKEQRERIRERHNQESELLFPVPKFDWEPNPCPDQFEKLIKSLLEREPGVKNVRIAAPINQGDKGRDLIIEWNIDQPFQPHPNMPAKRLIKVVGQCKVSVGPVGKSKVLDIRDTIETHESEGYFLAVSSQITVAITEKLESLKVKGIWTNWWNKEDIEKRLSKNQDLLPLYPRVLKAAYKIKFVDKAE